MYNYFGALHLTGSIGSTLPSFTFLLIEEAKKKVSCFFAKAFFTMLPQKAAFENI